jgi:hypothetical protein
VCGYQLVVALYGGYFGAGIGILMLAGLAWLRTGDIHQMNGLKSVLGGTINTLAAVVFIATGRVDWPVAAGMMGASIAGGFGAAAVSRKLDRELVRRVVTGLGFVLAAYYFWKQYGAGD